MKITMKKSFAVIMALVMCVSMLFGVQITSFAADTNNTVDYVYSGDYVYNWGEREEEATFLSPMAVDFYTKNNITLNSLLALDGNSSTSQTPYSDLFKELSSLMEDNHKFKTSYDGTKNLYRYTDCENNSTSAMSAFYSGKQLTPNWDSAATWNREHTWPNSKSNSGKSYTNRETDIIMLRPATPSNNSSRGNTAYGESSSYFNPNKFVGSTGYDVRGDAARAILYVYVRWGGSDSHDGALQYMWGSSGVIESKDVLLKWMQEDPVDTWEMGRNDATESITGTRNIFIDYPELAFDLFEADIPNHNTPSGYAESEGTIGGDIVGDGNTSGDDTTGDDNTTDTPSTSSGNIVFEFGEKVNSTTHKDGTDIGTTKAYTNGDYTLTLTDASKCFGGGNDATGNSTLKLGTSGANGSFRMTVPDKVTSVIFKVAQYKDYATTVKINDTEHTITGSSDSGVYDSITIDTTTTKTIDFKTVTKRCMIDSITYVVPGSSSEDENKVYVETDDIVISGFESAFPEGTSVSAQKITKGENTTIDTALNDIANDFEAYDLTAKMGDTLTQLNPGKTVTLTLAIPDGYDTDRVCIVYIPDTNEDESEVEILDSTVDAEARTVSAELTHFSYYAVAEMAETSDDGGDDGTTGGTAYYEKVTSAPANGDWSGQYLIVYETDKVAFNGSLNASTIDTANNVTSTLTITDGKIIADETTNANCFFIEAISGGYSIKSAGGAYIGNDGTSNGMSEHATTTYVNTISDTGVISGKGGCKLQFYKTTGSTGYRFRYYASSQQPVYLYKLVETGSSGGNTPETPTYTINYAVNDESMGSASLEGNVITAKAKAGYTLADGDDACTVTSGNATVVRDGDTFTVTAASDATVQINFVALPSYTATFIANGQTVATDSTYSGGKITLPEYNGELADNTQFKNWLADIDGKTYNAGEKYTLTANVTFTAQFFTVENGDAEVTEATITFDDTSKRTEFDNSHQVWKENGIIVTNNKGAATSNVADYKAPARFYKNSDLIVSLSSPNSKITKIVVNANTPSYANALADSISDDNVAVSINSKAVTILFSEAVYSFEVTLSSGQVQVDSMNVYTIATSGDDVPKYSVTFIENGNTIGKLSAALGSTITLPSKSGIVGEELIGWLAAGQSEVLAPGSTYAVTGDVTFTAKYKATESGSSGESTSYYQKVTSTENITSGDYLIVYEDGNIAFNGGLDSLDVANNYIEVEIKDGIIYANETTNAARVTIDVATGTLKSASGYYFGNSTTSSDNGLKSDKTTPYIHTFSIDDSGNADILCEVRYLRCNTSGGMRFRYYKSGQQAIQLYKLIEVDGGNTKPAGEIKGAQVNVGSDLSLSYYVDLINIDTTDNVVMKVTLDGKTTEINWDKNKIVDGKYIFTFNNIPPQCMTDNIKAELFLDGALLASLDYSIQQNAINLLAAYPNDPELKQFITDMLHYGAASQTYRGYNTNKLATAGVTGIGTPSTAKPSETDQMKLTSHVDEINDVYFKSATVWFDTVNKLIIKLNPNIESLESRNIRLYLNDKPVDLDENNTYTTAEIDATKFAEVYEFTLYEGDTHIQTLEYSINAYAYSKQNSTNEKMAALALALYRYGKSAEAYAASR